MAKPKPYAEHTAVSVKQSIAEVQSLLAAHGATKFAIDYTDPRILFEVGGRTVQIRVPLPAEDQFRFTPTKITRRPAARKQAWEQACKQRYRALYLVIRAKLEEILPQLPE